VVKKKKNEGRHHPKGSGRRKGRRVTIPNQCRNKTCEKKVPLDMQRKKGGLSAGLGKESGGKEEGKRNANEKAAHVLIGGEGTSGNSVATAKS